MVVKKFNLIGIIVLLGLMAPAVCADDTNNLVQLDLKRTSNDTVNVTLFTTNTYNDNVMVRKKSDNKYVILIPKVQSSGFSASNLNGVRDLVSDVDVKTIDDTNGGYTKVTLVTTKPLDIKTSSRKSAPATSEQKEYQTLIAQANAVKNNVAKQDAQPKLREQKTEVTVNKAPAEKTVNKALPKKQEAKLSEIKPTDTTSKKIKLEDIVPEITNAPEVKNKENTSELLPQLPELAREEQTAIVENTQVIPQQFSKLSHIKNKVKNLPKKAKVAFLVLLGLSILMRLMKGAAKNNNAPQATFIENVMPSSPEIDRVSNIVENSELSWKEKYQMYLDKSAVPVSRGENKGNYMFIKTPNIPKQPEKLEKLQRLEKLATQSVFNEIEPEIVENEIIESEDIVIQKAIKLKAFDNRSKSLKMTSRDKSRFKKYEVEIPLHEQKTIELGKSMLHSNPRSFADANLKITDVDKKRIKYEPKEYIMSSIDEYFSILDKEQTVAQPAAPKVRASNPIAKHRNEDKASYLKGLIVKSGFNIDDSKGFYLVNQDGQNALVGKVNDEVFVLKKFDKNVTSPIQVRHDKDNVYMVKAGDFKSLVEVNDKKMGVLIEL